MISNLQKSPPKGATAKPKIQFDRCLAHFDGAGPHREKLTFSRGSRLRQTACLQPRRQKFGWAEYGPNAVATEKQGGWLWRLFKASRNLLVILLAVLATVSFATGDFSGGT